LDSSLRLELPAVNPSVGHARRAVGELGDRLGCDSVAVRTVISELVTNCVIHAYVDRDPGQIIVDASPEGRTLVVSVSDRGRGLGPRLDSPGLGLGLPITSRLANDVRINSGDEGATVSVRFDCDGLGPRDG
jgi:serine/threonine-protein kinase RsbW